MKLNFGQALGAKQNQPKSTDRTFEWVERQQVANLMEEQPMSDYQTAGSGGDGRQFTNFTGYGTNSSNETSGTITSTTRL